MCEKLEEEAAEDSVTAVDEPSRVSKSPSSFSSFAANDEKIFFFGGWLPNAAVAFISDVECKPSSSGAFPASDGLGSDEAWPPLFDEVLAPPNEIRRAFSA